VPAVTRPVFSAEAAGQPCTATTCVERTSTNGNRHCYNKLRTTCPGPMASQAEGVGESKRLGSWASQLGGEAAVAPSDQRMAP